jgi:hypothetical protein
MVFQCLQQDRGERVLLIQRRTRCERTEMKDFRRSLRDGRAGCGNRRAGEQLDKFASSHSHRLRKPRARHRCGFNQDIRIGGVTSAMPPIATELVLRNEQSLCAKSRHMQCNKMTCSLHGYSITSSACWRKGSGIVRPSAFAVLRLTTSSNLAANCTGRSPGLAPFKIRST